MSSRKRKFFFTGNDDDDDDGDDGGEDMEISEEEEANSEATDSNGEQDNGSEEETEEGNHHEFDLMFNPIPTVLELMPYFFNDVQGDINKNLEVFENKWRALFFLCKQLPKTALYKDFNKEFEKDKRSFKRQYDGDGISFASPSDMINEIMEITMESFRSRFKRIVNQYLDEQENDADDENNKEEKQ